MNDNVIADPGVGGAAFATIEFNFSGDSVHAPGGFIFGASGSEGSWTAAPIPGDATDGLLVNLGSNNDVTNSGDFLVQVDGINGVIDSNNSSEALLGIGATFTGVSTNILQVASITLSVFSDVASAVDGLEIQFSKNGTDWDHTDVFTIPAGTGKTYSFQPVAEFMRVLYTNGGTGQSDFRLSVRLASVTSKPSSHRIADSISDQDDVEIVKAVLTGENPGGSFVNFQATTAGNFKVALEEVNGVVMPVENANVVSVDNSTTATLGISGVFTGTGDDVSNYSTVTVTIDASHDSATNGMSFEFSTDNVNWDDIYLFTYTAADGARRFQFPVTAKYFRTVYTNGTTGQTHLRIQTILHVSAGLTTIHRLSDDINPDRSATLVKSIIVAQAAGSGDFKSVQATAGGNLKVAIEEFDAPLPAGTNNIGDVDVLTQPARSTTVDNIGVAHQTNQMLDGTTSLTPKFAAISVSSAGDNTLVTAVASKKIRVLQVTLIAAAANTVRFESGAGGSALTGQMQIAANGGFEASFCPIGLFETAVNTLLNLELSAGTSVDGWLVYVEV